MIESLTCEVQMYKHEMLSYVLLESEVEYDGEKENGYFSRNNSVGESSDGRFDIPSYDYPTLKSTINENQMHTEVNDEVVDIDKYAFGEAPRSCDNLRYLGKRINQLETTPSSRTNGEVFNNNILEKAIVAQSPFVPNKEICSDFISGSPKFGGSVGKAENSQTEEYANLGRWMSHRKLGMK